MFDSVKMASTSSATPVNSSLGALSDDIVDQIVLYTDAASAIDLFSAQVSPNISSYVWREIYRRHGFSSQDIDHSIIEELRYRRRLFAALIPLPNERFLIHQRQYSFRPVLPVYEDWQSPIDDAPPVDFECDSFLLTSSGTSAEYVFLDPFSSTLTIYDSILPHTIRDGLDIPWLAGIGQAKTLEELEQVLEPPRPKQQLVSMESSLEFDLSNYHWTADDMELEICNLGIDCRPILDDEDNITATSICLGRLIVNADDDNDVVGEVLVWKRAIGEPEFIDRRVCRLRRHLRHLQTDDRFVYAVGIENQAVMDVYPLVEETSEWSDAFPPSIGRLDCGSAITTLAVGPRDMMLATRKSELHFWKPSLPQQTAVNVKAALAKTLNACGRGDSNVNVGAVEMICTPLHRTLDHFVTFQSSHQGGPTLLLWKRDQNGADVQSMVNLPLLARRTPKMHYDGRRLIVFGQDHIGYIILVYHCNISGEDYAAFASANEPVGQEGSGGVINFTSPPRLRFVNRIRHVALGGLHTFDSIHMTVNERFLIVNTKQGNLLPTSFAVPGADGLLVIDLDQEMQR